MSATFSTCTGADLQGPHTTGTVLTGDNWPLSRRVSPTSRRCARSPSAIKSFDRVRVECDSGVPTRTLHYGNHRSSHDRRPARQPTHHPADR